MEEPEIRARRSVWTQPQLLEDLPLTLPLFPAHKVERGVRQLQAPASTMRPVSSSVVGRFPQPTSILGPWPANNQPVNLILQMDPAGTVSDTGLGVISPR